MRVVRDPQHPIPVACLCHPSLPTLNVNQGRMLALIDVDVDARECLVEAPNLPTAKEAWAFPPPEPSHRMKSRRRREMGARLGRE
jgi:hypothetical protein